MKHRNMTKLVQEKCTAVFLVVLDINHPADKMSVFTAPAQLEMTHLHTAKANNIQIGL